MRRTPTRRAFVTPPGRVARRRGGHVLIKLGLLLVLLIQGLPTSSEAAEPPDAAIEELTPEFLPPMPKPGSASSSEPPSAEGKSAAAAEAEKDQKPKEGWTSSSHWWTNPDGSRSAEIAAGPVYFQDEKGDWQPIDLVLSANGPDKLRPKAAGKRAARLSRRSAGDLVTVGSAAGDLILRHPGASDVEGEIVSDRALFYRDALGPERDLTLIPTTDGFEERVTIPDRTSPGFYLDEFLLPSGVTGRHAGWGIEFVDSSGLVVAVFGSGLAADSSAGQPGAGAESPVRARLLIQEGTKAIVEVSADPVWLADPRRVFPVVIDPTYQDTTASSGALDTYANSDNPNAHPVSSPPGDGGPWYAAQNHLRTGSPGGCESPSTEPPCPLNRTRSFLRFPIDSVVPSSATVTSATFKLYNYYSYDLIPYTVDLYGLASPPGYYTNWNNQPGLDGSGVVDSEYFAHGDSGETTPCYQSQAPVWPTCDNGAWVTFTITTLAGRWLTQGNNGLALYARSETTRNAFRKYYFGTVRKRCRADHPCKLHAPRDGACEVDSQRPGYLSGRRSHHLPFRGYEPSGVGHHRQLDF